MFEKILGRSDHSSKSKGKATDKGDDSHKGKSSSKGGEKKSGQEKKQKVISRAAFDLFTTGVDLRDPHAFDDYDTPIPAAEIRAECLAYSEVGLDPRDGADVSGMSDKEKNAHYNKRGKDRGKVKDLMKDDLGMPVFKDLLEHTVGFADLSIGEQQGFYHIFVLLPPHFRHLFRFYDVVCAEYQRLLRSVLDEPEDRPGEWGFTRASLAERMTHNPGSVKAMAEYRAKNPDARRKTERTEANTRLKDPEKAKERRKELKKTTTKQWKSEHKTEHNQNQRDARKNKEAWERLGRQAQNLWQALGGGKLRDNPEVAAQYPAGVRAEVFAYQETDSQKTWPVTLEGEALEKAQAKEYRLKAKVKKKCGHEAFANMLAWPKSKGTFFGDRDDTELFEFCDYFFGSEDGRVRGLASDEQQCFPYIQNACAQFLSLNGLALPATAAPLPPQEHQVHPNRGAAGHFQRSPSSPMSPSTGMASLTLGPTESGHHGGSGAGPRVANPGTALPGDPAYDPPVFLTGGLDREMARRGHGPDVDEFFNSEHNASRHAKRKGTQLMSQTLGAVGGDPAAPHNAAASASATGSKRPNPDDSHHERHRDAPAPPGSSSSTTTTTTQQQQRPVELGDDVALGTVLQNGAGYNFYRSGDKALRKTPFFWVDQNGVRSNFNFKFDDDKASEVQGWAVDPDKRRKGKPFRECLVAFYCRTHVDGKTRKKHDMFYFNRTTREPGYNYVHGMDQVARGW